MKREDSTDTRSAINRSYRSLLRASARFLSRGDSREIRRALNMAIDACAGGVTVTGTNCILHSLSVARIVAADMGLGRTSVISAILHYGVENNRIPISAIETEFGQGVSRILSGFSRVSAVETIDSVNQAATFRKLILSLADDVRVVVIKLAERLVYMRDLEGADEENRLRLASETYFVYAPLAYRLGFYLMKSEMEDLSMRYLEPEQYSYIVEKLRQTTSSRNRLIREFIAPLREKLDAAGLSYSVKGRTKSVHSIWQKMKKQGVEFEEVYDLFAIRIIVDTLPEREKYDCWQVYSLVTDLYQPNPSRLRDWISVPKSNGYESLHTTVVGPRGKWVEVQIRTERMDELAERGVAAHFRYKGLKGEKRGLEVWLSRMRELLEKPDREEEAFVDQVKSGLYSDEVFVFTPRGDIKQLPAGSTVLDFAYEIHTEVGSGCVGARVNGKNVTIKQILKNGDHVSVIRSKNQKPKSDWLSFVKTGKARAAIKSALNEAKMAEAVEGKEMLMRRLKNWKIGYSDKVVMRLLGHYGLKKAQDLYCKIASSDIEMLDIKEFLKTEPSHDASVAGEETAEIQIQETESGKRATQGDYLVIENKIEGVDYRLSGCCNPVYGDKVFGFVTISEGIKIHRTVCPNAENMITRYPYRVVPARWTQSGSAPSFSATLKFTSVEDMAVISKISSVLADTLVNVRGISHSAGDGLYEGTIYFTVPNVDILQELIRKISAVRGVLRVVRAGDSSG